MHNVEMAPGELLDTEKGPLSTRGELCAVNTKTFIGHTGDSVYRILPVEASRHGNRPPSIADPAMVAFFRGFFDVIKWEILGTRNMLAIHGSRQMFLGNSVPCRVSAAVGAKSRRIKNMS